MKIKYFTFLYVIALLLFNTICLVENSSKKSNRFTKDVLDKYKNRVKDMFYHAYDNYIYNAYPFDELKPITCKGFDTWGSYSLTLVDSLDMLIILGNKTEFERVVSLLPTQLNFDRDINVSVFETNIRVIGGLLSAHLLSYRLYLDESEDNIINTGRNLHPAWPCDGPLLKLAVEAADKLLPAFQTATGMPFGTVNFKNGVPLGETTETCVAGVGTFLIEFATLSRLTGNSIYEKTALKALDSLWKARSSINLIGNHLNVDTGKWTGVDATIGSGVDSYFEYLVKGGILLDRHDLIDQFRSFQRSINKYLYHDNWYFWANMNKGQKTLPLFSSLEAFYPGLLTLTGDLDQAIKSIKSYNQIWRQFGGLPEFFNIQQNTIHSNRDAYPLRPELIESLMYVLRATNNEASFLEMGVDYLESIERIGKLDCGFATVKDVKTHKLDNRMESFFLAETLKYLYLIFDTENFLHNDISSNSYKIVKNQKGECLIETGYFIFNTEAHPVDGASLECCRILRQNDLKDSDEDLEILDNLNLNNLINTYLFLKNPSRKIDYDDMIENFSFKSMKDEYLELKSKIESIERKKQATVKNICDSMTGASGSTSANTNPFEFIHADKIDADFYGHNRPFSCYSNNDTFKLFTSYLDNYSYYP